MNRLTTLGWIVLLLSIACGIVVGTVFLLWWQQTFPNANWRMRAGPGCLVVVATIAGLFVLAKKLFSLADIEIVLHQPSDGPKPH